jgi:RHS repeat-associated protein
MLRFEYADGRMPVAMTKGGVTYYLTYDQVGSLRIVVDASGNVVKRVNYDSFGNIIDNTDPLFKVPFGFAGGLHDRDTGLVRFGYRDYDPDIGRWTAKDPIFFAGGDTDIYGYCLNDPNNIVDPWGLMSPWIGYTAEAIMGAGVVAITYGLLTSNPVVTGAGLGLFFIGGTLYVYNWVKSPLDAMKETKEDLNHLMIR